MTVLLIASSLLVLAILGVGALLHDPSPAAAPAPARTPPRPPASSPAPPDPASPSPDQPSPEMSSPAVSSPPVPSPAARPPSSAPSPAPAVVRYGPVTFEAEAGGNALGGSAWVASYPGASGGRIVRNLGDWNAREGAGTLRFEDITVPVAGLYTLRIFHVNLDNERTRTIVVTVSGAEPRSFAIDGSSTCCTVFTLQVPLRKGRNAITLGNPAGHAPSVDRVVLSLP
jgi:hypothetical protein